MGDWKLHFHKDGQAIQELYNLREDIGETRNRYDDEPDVVAELSLHADNMRQDLGDKLTHTEGTGRRSSGYVENPKPLTEYREDHPYMIAMYDLPDMPTLSG